ncbi:[FeFe] hydrogenase H-cluster radical SAM maturase HydG [Acidaminococcus intestini]|nr:[FeFe] hydrogenase H-cluster radical SAM maturase HydG [Acidaminococcus intestini]
MTIPYNPASSKADEFINHEEIMETLAYADEKSQDKEFCLSLVEKASHLKGLSHREASVLLKSEDSDVTEAIYDLARKIKDKIYGQRIVLFAPLYLSNYCINGCVYCPYHAKNRHIARKKLTQEEIVREVTALQDMGHKRLALETGEDPVNNPIEYVLESIHTIYSIKHKNRAIRRVNVNIAATTVENYRKLKEAGIGTYILFQETYHRKNYEILHPHGPKHDYAYHTEAMDRAMTGGLTTLESVSFMDSTTIGMTLPAFSCIRNTWKPSSVLAPTPSAFPAFVRLMIFPWMRSPTPFPMTTSKNHCHPSYHGSLYRYHHIDP